MIKKWLFFRALSLSLSWLLSNNSTRFDWVIKVLRLTNSNFNRRDYQLLGRGTIRHNALPGRQLSLAPGRVDRSERTIRAQKTPFPLLLPANCWLRLGEWSSVCKFGLWRGCLWHQLLANPSRTTPSEFLAGATKRHCKSQPQHSFLKFFFIGISVSR